jgi:hypothetical protein
MGKAIDRSFLNRILLTTALPLALLTASVSVRAETVIGADGAPGADGVNTNDPGEPGGDGGSAAALANPATAIGGNGGAGGNAFPFIFGEGGNGGNGGAATATAATMTILGTADANANAFGGAGGSNGSGGEDAGDGAPGAGGSASATSTAMTVSSGAALSSANATGGAGGPAVISQGPSGNGGGGGANAKSTAISGVSGDATSSATATGGSTRNQFVGTGGDAAADSAATSNGSGNASSSASASAGSGGNGFDVPVAAAVANSSTSGSGTATAKAVATTVNPFEQLGTPNATSNAETEKGALAQAQSTAVGSGGQAQSTAKTSFAGVSVQSTTVAPTDLFGITATTNATAQGGSGQAFANPVQTAYAFSTALPDKAYAATLIGGASDVASALLKPRDEVFGTAILGANYATDGGGESLTYTASSTFDFAYRGNLELGLIDSQLTGFASGAGFQSMEFTIEADGVEILDTTFRSLSIAQSFFRDQVIDLGSDLGPDIDLTFGYTLVANGTGGFGLDFAIGGAVPESSTWAMMLLGLVGLGFVGYRTSRDQGAAAE